jgi:signal peptidase I
MRIVAVAQDTVEVRCGHLYINGQRVPTEHVDGECAYWDNVGSSSEQLECSAYRETIGGHSYDTIHAPFRPIVLERVLRDPAYRYSATTLADSDFPLSGAVPSCASGRAVASARGRQGRIVATENASAECAPQRRYVVPEGHVFVLGDNRHHSSDSRRWGPVPIEHIEGKAFLIWWSSRPAEQGGVDWSRLETPIR